MHLNIPDLTWISPQFTPDKAELEQQIKAKLKKE
jgi:hypothetical protein